MSALGPVSGTSSSITTVEGPADPFPLLPHPASAVTVDNTSTADKRRRLPCVYIARSFTAVPSVGCGESSSREPRSAPALIGARLSVWSVAQYVREASAGVSSAPAAIPSLLSRQPVPRRDDQADHNDVFHRRGHRVGTCIHGSIPSVKGRRANRTLHATPASFSPRRRSGTVRTSPRGVVTFRPRIAMTNSPLPTSCNG